MKCHPITPLGNRYAYMKCVLQTNASFKILRTTNVIQQINTRKEEKLKNHGNASRKVLTEIDIDF